MSEKQLVTSISQQLISFIQDELGISDYLNSTMLFKDSGVESFQVLEIILQIERVTGVKSSVSNLSSADFESLDTLLNRLVGSSDPIARAADSLVGASPKQQQKL